MVPRVGAKIIIWPAYTTLGLAFEVSRAIVGDHFGKLPYGKTLTCAYINIYPHMHIYIYTHT